PPSLRERFGAAKQPGTWFRVNNRDSASATTCPIRRRNVASSYCAPACGEWCDPFRSERKPEPLHQDRLGRMVLLTFAEKACPRSRCGCASSADPGIELIRHGVLLHW